MSQLGRGVRPVPIHPDVRRLALSCLLLSYTGPVPPSWLTAALGGGVGGVGPVGDNLADAPIAARLVEAGVTLNLAPVADVNSDPRNPVIGVRSFGAEPDRAAAQV